MSEWSNLKPHRLNPAGIASWPPPWMDLVDALVAGRCAEALAVHPPWPREWAADVPAKPVGRLAAQRLVAKWMRSYIDALEARSKAPSPSDVPRPRRQLDPAREAELLRSLEVRPDTPSRPLRRLRPGRSHAAYATGEL